MARFFFVAVSWMVLALPMAATASVVWFSTDENLFRADTITNTIAQTLPIKGIASLVVDSQRAA